MRPRNEGRPGQGASLRVPSRSLQAVPSPLIVTDSRAKFNRRELIGGAP